jgi:hypothetical protein
MSPESLSAIWADGVRALCNHLWQSTFFLGFVTYGARNHSQRHPALPGWADVWRPALWAFERLWTSRSTSVDTSSLFLA